MIDRPVLQNLIFPKREENSTSLISTCRTVDVFDGVAVAVASPSPLPSQASEPITPRGHLTDGGWRRE